MFSATLKTNFIYKIILLSFLILSVINSDAQTLKWANHFGGTGVESGDDVQVATISGNVYHCGAFQDTVDFDPGLGVSNLISAGFYDIYLQKLDSNGNLRWAVSFGDVGWDVMREIKLDDEENIYAIGSFDGTIDFDPGPGVFNLSAGSSNDLFLLKLDSGGNFIWAKQIDAFDARGESLVLDNQGNIYYTGSYSGTADFDLGTGTFNLSSNGGYDAFISKIDTAGNFIWAINWGGQFSDLCGKIELKGDRLCVLGLFEDTVDFDPGIDSTKLIAPLFVNHVYISKFDTAGNFIWVKQLEGNMLDEARDLAFDSNDDIVIVGKFQDTIDLDPGDDTLRFISEGSQDIFMLKLNQNGDLVWGNRFGSFGSLDDLYGVEIDADDNITVAGHFSSNVDFDPGPDTFELNSFFGSILIAEYCPSGDLIWADQFAGSGNNRIYALYLDDEKHLYTTGLLYAPSGDLDPGPGTAMYNNNGGSDNFISKIKAPDFGSYTITPIDTTICSGDVINITIQTTDSFVLDSTWYQYDMGCGTGLIDSSSNGIFNVNVNTSTVLYFSNKSTCYNSIQSCDSVTITINNSSVNEIDTNICLGDSILINGQFRATQGAYSDTLISSIGCDSIINNTLTIDSFSEFFITPSSGSVIRGIPIDLTASGGNTYLWQNGIESETVTAYLETSDSFCVTAFKGACVDSSCVFIEVLDNECGVTSFFMPNAFSPDDGQNMNQQLSLIKDLQCVEELDFKLFDSKGKLIFESNNPLFKWNAIFRDTNINSSVVTYWLKVKLLGDKQVTQTGNITILR